MVITAVKAIIENNNIIGFVASDISLENLPQILSENIVGKNGKTILMTDTGTIVYSEDQAMISSNINQYDAFSSVTKKLMNGESGSIRLEYNGKPYLCYFDYMKVNGWGVLQMADEQEAFTRLERYKELIALIYCVCIAILFVVIFLAIDFKIRKPIAQLSKGIDEISIGDFKNRLIKNSKDEIGELASKYNIMADSLETYRNEIEKKAKELKIQNNELEEKNTELKRFTYTVSHDLKSPLITIKSFTGIISDDIKKGRYDRIEGDIRRVQNATDKMQELLDGLLELSRIGRIINPNEEVSMTELVNQVVELLHGRITEKKITVSVMNNMPIVFVDANRIRAALQNLIENSIKFIDKENGFIDIGCKKNSDKIIFYVKDNGIGIEEKYHQKIFELFDKLDKNSEGTGIGLAIVKRIIEVHGGEIWVESELGKGTVFYFTLG